MVRVKICGITTVEDARLCWEAGADALGFIFVRGTPRHLTPGRAASIIATLPPFVTPVGVFWDHPAAEIKAVAEECGLRALQLHGTETPEDAAAHRLPVIKTLKVGGPEDLDGLGRYRVAAFLLDSPARWSEGEARPPIPWELARRATEAGHRIILSGGLTPESVAEAIRVARPYAVDVNSGVERRPGLKDPDAVRRFVSAAKGPARS
jgi:phosphoribosylanthranilate isomerase